MNRSTLKSKHCVTVKIVYDGYMKRLPFVKISGQPILDFVNTFAQHSDHFEDTIESAPLAQAFFKEVFKVNYKLTKKEHTVLLSRRQGLRNILTQFSKPNNRHENLSFWPLNQVFKLKLRLANWAHSNLKKPRIQFQTIDLNKTESVLFNHAILFLSSYDPIRLKKCKSLTCSHLFYDTSKSNTRAWCSMKSCGNLAKVRNFRKLNSL